MTQHVLTTATSPRPVDLAVPVARAAARAAPARRSARPCSRGNGRRSSPSARKIYSAHVQIGRPAAVLDAPLDPVAVELRVVRDEVAGRDRPRRPQPRRERERPPRRRCWRARGRRPGSSSLAQVGLADVDRDAVVGRVPLASPRPPAGRSRTPAPGSKPSFAAAIERTPEPQPMSSTLPRSSPASSSRQSCVVGCPPVPNARPGSITTAIASVVGVLPRRADPEPADADRLVELPPAVLPVVLDVGGCGAAERLPDPLLAGGVRVGGELEPASRLRSPRIPPGRARASRRAPAPPARRGRSPRRGAERHAQPDIQRMRF